MKLKTNNSAKKPVNTNKNKSPKKQGKGGVQVRKEKSKDIVKPTVLKKEGEKVKVETPPNPEKLALQGLWAKAIQNVSNLTNLSDEESSIAKLLGDYKNKSSVPQKKIKLKNMITKGFSKFKDTSDEVLDGLYEKLISEFKAVGGNVDNINKKPDRAPKSKKEEVSNDEEIDDDEVEEDEVDDNEVDDDDDDEIEGLEVDDDDDDDDEESEEEKPKPKGKGAFKNGKSQPNNGKNGTKFKGGKVQKNKKFGKKK